LLHFSHQVEILWKSSIAGEKNEDSNKTDDEIGIPALVLQAADSIIGMFHFYTFAHAAA